MSLAPSHHAPGAAVLAGPAAGSPGATAPPPSRAFGGATDPAGDAAGNRLLDLTTAATLLMEGAPAGAGPAAEEPSPADASTAAAAAVAAAAAASAPPPPPPSSQQLLQQRLIRMGDGADSSDALQNVHATGTMSTTAAPRRPNGAPVSAIAADSRDLGMFLHTVSMMAAKSGGDRPARPPGDPSTATGMSAAAATLAASAAAAAAAAAGASPSRGSAGGIPGVTGVAPPPFTLLGAKPGAFSAAGGLSAMDEDILAGRAGLGPSAGAKRAYSAIVQLGEERPHKCPTCNAAFTRSHDLRRHQKTHTNLKEFRCDQCLKEFTRLDALRRHLRTTAGKGGCAVMVGLKPPPGSVGGAAAVAAAAKRALASVGALGHLPGDSPQDSDDGLDDEDSLDEDDGDEDVDDEFDESDEPRRFLGQRSGGPASGLGTHISDGPGDPRARPGAARHDRSPRAAPHAPPGASGDAPPPPWSIGHSAASMLSAAAAAVQGQELLFGGAPGAALDAGVVTLPQQPQLLPSLLTAAAAAAAQTGGPAGPAAPSSPPAAGRSGPGGAGSPGRSPGRSRSPQRTAAGADAGESTDEAAAAGMDPNTVMQNYALAAAAMAQSGTNPQTPMALISFDIYNSLMAHIASLEQRTAFYEEELKKKDLLVQVLGDRLKEHGEDVDGLSAAALAAAAAAEAAAADSAPAAGSGEPAAVAVPKASDEPDVVL